MGWQNDGDWHSTHGATSSGKGPKRGGREKRRTGGVELGGGRAGRVGMALWMLVCVRFDSSSGGRKVEYPLCRRPGGLIIIIRGLEGKIIL